MDEYASINAEYKINVAKITNDFNVKVYEITKANAKWVNDNLPKVADVKAAYAIYEPEIGLAVRVLMRQPYQEEFSDMTRGHDNPVGMKREKIEQWLGVGIEDFLKKVSVESAKIEKLKGAIFSPDDYKKIVNNWLNTYWMDKKIYDLYDNTLERITALETKKNADIKRIQNKQNAEIERTLIKTPSLKYNTHAVEHKSIKTPSLKSNTHAVEHKSIKTPSLKSNTHAVEHKSIKSINAEILKKAYATRKSRKAEILKKAYAARERRNTMKKSGGQRRRKARKTYKKRI
jgi:hypothetical protein